ncbi:methanol metabolism-related c-type cytochrome [Azospirillum lipoferum]|uniref:C-type cytochrome n=1 Tax=Azospirillum lipoferum TaxID=193 RepID=A0A5A9G3F6_AZOLI|nr:MULTISPECIES: c-type cytochrome [Azospirillum]KAA0589110.1 c-type cytochrome [Azospirillum lipoferum]MCP1613449.1 methanol metabolism-related c-type cytochrome [Azospirillum lipoferum]MDW5533116.1 c-type cytochrome [Azospirillum sp. NL1]
MPKYLTGLCVAVGFTATVTLGTAFGQQDAAQKPAQNQTPPNQTQNTAAQPSSGGKGPQEAKVADPEELVDDQGVPLYTVRDGKVDQGTYNGYRRYASSCHVCHGPDGLGSSFAPALAESLKRMDYWQFTDVVTNGRKNMGATGDKVMPTFGSDPNVMLNLADIYRYLKARSDDKIGRGRPERFKTPS